MGNPPSLLSPVPGTETPTPSGRRLRPLFHWVASLMSVVGIVRIIADPDPPRSPVSIYLFPGNEGRQIANLPGLRGLKECLVFSGLHARRAAKGE